MTQAGMKSNKYSTPVDYGISIESNVTAREDNELPGYLGANV
jgi:hypothetical protein